MEYKGEIGGYSFIMKDDVIEVWFGTEDDYPYAFIYVKAGSIKTEKDFHFEIMSWFSQRN